MFTNLVNPLYCKLEQNPHFEGRCSFCFSHLLSAVSFASFGFQTVGSQASSWARPPSSILALAPVTVMASEISSFSSLIFTMFGSRTTPFNSLTCKSSRIPSLTRTSFILRTLFNVFDMLLLPPTSTRYRAPVSSLKKCRHRDGSPGHIRECPLQLLGRVETLAVLLKNVAGLDVFTLKSSHQLIKIQQAEFARQTCQRPKISVFQKHPSCYSCSWARFQCLFEDPLTGNM